MTSRCSCVVRSGCWGHPLLITEHHAFIKRQRDSSPYTATQAAGISPGAFCLLCSCELSLCPSFCNEISTCGDKIPFFSVTLQTTGCVLGVMPVNRSNAGIQESKSSSWGNSSGKRRKLKKVKWPWWTAIEGKKWGKKKKGRLIGKGLMCESNIKYEKYKKRSGKTIKIRNKQKEKA